MTEVWYNEDMKTCTKCKAQKSLGEFCKDAQKKDGLSTRCRSCNSKQGKEYYEKNKVERLAKGKKYVEENLEKRAAYLREWRARTRENRQGTYNKIQNLKKYGMTLEDYDSMLEAQDYVCIISERPHGTEPKTVLCVDHCHSCDEVRGLLNQKINMALGIFNDDPKLLRIAADYLEKHACRGREVE